jgi:phage shock protein A
MTDTDIEGLDPKDAAEYVLAFVTTMKQTETDLARNAEEIATWTRRVALAVEKGEASLADQARAKLAEIEAKKTALVAELADLRLKVGILKDKLQRLRARFQRSVDPDVLLAELEMLAGKKDPLADRFKAVEAGAKVEELKKRMAGGTPEGGTPERSAGGS